MAFTKKNSENNAICTLEFGFSDTSLIIFGAGNYDRFSTSNFIIEVYTIDPSNNNKVIARENIFVTSRVGNQFNIASLSDRAYEAVPIDDDQTSNIKQALVFVKENTIVRQVVSKDFMDEVSDELVRLETDKLSITDYNQEKNVFGASSQGDDDYVITDASLTSYQDGQPIRFRADVANNGVATLEINSLGPKDLKKNQGTENLVTGDIKVDGIVTAVYNSALDVFQFVGQVATVVSAASYPTNIYVSSSTVGTNNGVFTFTHNLGFTQADVEAGKYKVTLVGKYFTDGIQSGDTNFSTSPWTNSNETVHRWNAGNPADLRYIHHQSNSLKVLLSGVGAQFTFRCIVQQMYP